MNSGIPFIKIADRVEVSVDLSKASVWWAMRLRFVLALLASLAWATVQLSAQDLPPRAYVN